MCSGGSTADTSTPGSFSLMNQCALLGQFGCQLPHLSNGNKIHNDLYARSATEYHKDGCSGPDEVLES